MRDSLLPFSDSHLSVAGLPQGTWSEFIKEQCLWCTREIHDGVHIDFDNDEELPHKFVATLGSGNQGSVCVLSVILLSRYMRPEGPWQRLAAALADSSDHFSAFNYIPSQIEMIDPSRAP